MLQGESEAWTEPAFVKPLNEIGLKLSEKFAYQTEMLQEPARALMTATGTDDLGTACWVFSVISIFGLSLVLSLIEYPLLRKLFSTTFGFVFGFYIFGPGYVWNLLQFMVIYVVLAVLPREAGAKVGHVIAFATLTMSNLYVFWLGVGKNDFIFRSQLLQNFVKLHMTLCNYNDAGKLSDPEKKKLMTPREIY